MKKVSILVVLAVFVALLAACGGGGGSASGGEQAAGGAAATGNAANGETLFKQSVIGQNPGCATCHSLDGSQLVGPTLQGIGTRAATRVEGQSAEQYTHASIVDPNAYVVEGFTQGVMPSYQDLSEAQVNDLVAYLLTLK
jgi:cytochrome c